MGARVPREVAARRLAICQRCPYFVASQWACSICGCDMRKKASLRVDPIESAKARRPVLVRCPKGKWR